MKGAKPVIPGAIFSEARFVVLRTVYLSGAGVSLREIAYRSELSLGAVQTAIKSLLRLELLIKVRSGKRILFRLNVTHSEYELLAALFELSTKRKLVLQAQEDSKANKRLLKTLTEMNRFARALKESSHGV